jgi:hypothetical protein
MTMTREKALAILERGGGTTNLDGILEVHEAMLYLNGCTDDVERAERMDAIRRAHLGQADPGN